MICIVTGDKYFAAGVSAGLSQMGLESKISKNFDRSCPLHICDLDFVESVPQYLNFIGASYDEKKAEGVESFLLRPYRLSEFFAAVSAYTKSAGANANSGGGKCEGGERGKISGGADFSESDTIQKEKINFSEKTRVLSLGGKSVRLSQKECELLSLFIKQKGIVARNDGGKIFDGDGTNALDVYVCYLRKKLSVLTDRKLIFTDRGAGYRFDLEKVGLDL